MRALERHSPVVTLYARRDCHLCDEARAEIEALREEGIELELREFDITSDDLLLGRYLERIPVVELEGELVSELTADMAALRARLDTVSA